MYLKKNYAISKTIFFSSIRKTEQVRNDNQNNRFVFSFLF